MSEGRISLRVVTPERLLREIDVRMVVLPGVEGDFGALERHAPVVSALRPGVVAVHGEDGGDEELVVTGGFAEVTGTRVVVLAEEAVPRAEFSLDALSERIAVCEKRGEDGRASALRQLARELA